jgi:GT2 family glycosyltransferase
MSVKKQSSPVVVAGMHRSGTSLLASILSALSIDMGPALLPADSNNVRGYFEDVEFLQLQRAILSACCASNDGGHPDWGWTENETLDPTCFERFMPEASALIASRADRTVPWGWKDPRTTLLLNFWDRLVDDARYVLVYRFPWDVADSIQRLGADVFLRNPEYGYKIWEFYNRHIRDFYVKHSDRCLLICTNALRGNHAELARLIESKLRIQLSNTSADGIDEPDLLKSIDGCDPLIDLVAAVWPGCTSLLSELDDLADISAAGLWRARPVRSRLARPDSSAEEGSIDVSVVTPCYNQGALLVESIASVERCAPPGCELIIVNDGSHEPRTLEILEILKRCGYFILDQENQGLSAVRNTAVSMARGRYILPLDDDNRIRPNFIQDAKRVLDSSPDVGVVYGDRYELGLRTGGQHVPEFDLHKILEDNYIDACAMFRKELWKSCEGYDPRMSPWEDWELWVNAAGAGWRFHHLPYPCFDYRVRPDSLIARTSTIETHREVRERILRKHPGSHVGLLSSKVVAKEEQVALLSAQLAAEREQGHVLSVVVEQVKRQILERDTAIQSLAVDIAAGRQHLKHLSDQLAERDLEVARIKGSAGWRVLESYGRIKYRYLLPVYRLLGLMPKDTPVHATPALEDAGNMIALVTANFGGIDEVRALPDHHGVDAFYYTDQPVSPEVARTWTRVITPEYPRDDFSPRLRAKYFKLQIHRLDEVRNHRWLVWADATLKFRDLSFLTEHALALARLPVHKRALMIPHPDRATLIEEFEFCQKLVLDGLPYLTVRYANEKMREQVDYYRARGWNVQAKLWCGTFWMVENTELIRQAFNEWWDHNLRFGIQDQLSLAMVLQNNGIEPTPLAIEPRQNAYFDWTNHLNKTL